MLLKTLDRKFNTSFFSTYLNLILNFLLLLPYLNEASSLIISFLCSETLMCTLLPTECGLNFLKCHLLMQPASLFLISLPSHIAFCHYTPNTPSFLFFIVFVNTILFCFPICVLRSLGCYNKPMLGPQNILNFPAKQ